MKLSTKIKNYVPEDLVFGTEKWSNPKRDYTQRAIVLMVDCERRAITHSLTMADEYHRYLTKDEHCTLLPLNECPVVNDHEIIMHYTSTTYKEWCDMSSRSKEAKEFVPEAFYTGGGIYISAMYIDENTYYTIDNCTYYECFAIYDHRGEDQDSDFPCENMVGFKEKCNFSATDHKIFKKLKKALEKEMNR